ncbi:MAG: hypothetical protein RLZZ244_1008, partial [Verrucomicrobiota bacterium]
MEASEAAEQVGQELLFAGDDAGHFPDEGGVGRVAREGFEEGLFPAHEQEGALGIDVGDEQRCEEQALGLASGLERGEKGVAFFVEVVEGEF